MIDAQKFSRRVNLTDAERTKALAVIRDAEKEFLRALRAYTQEMLKRIQESIGKDVIDDLTGKPFELDDTSTYDELRRVKVLSLAAAEEQEDQKRRLVSTDDPTFLARYDARLDPAIHSRRESVDDYCLDWNHGSTL